MMIESRGGSAPLDPLPGWLKIPRAERLSDAQRAIEQKVATYVQHDFDDFVERYKALPAANGGRYISADIAKELLPDYTADPIRTTRAVHNTSSLIAEEVFTRALDSEDNSATDVAVITGPPGAGKTRAFQHLTIGRQTKLEYECNLSDGARAQSRMEKAFAKGLPVSVFIVFADPVVCLHRVILRAKGEGRVVDIQYISQTFVQLRETLVWLEERYKDRFKMILIDNTKEWDPPNPVTPEISGDWKATFCTYEFSKLLADLRKELQRMRAEDVQSTTAEVAAIYDEMDRKGDSSPATAQP